MRNAVDVQPAGGDVGGHQHRRPIRLERGQRPLANVLALVAVDRRGPNAGANQVLDDLVGPVLGAGEHERPRERIVLQIMREQVRLVPLLDEVDRLLDQLDRRGDRRRLGRASGRGAIRLASLRISGGIVAENISVCRALGTEATIFRSGTMKPMSSIWSASSRISISTLRRLM